MEVNLRPQCTRDKGQVDEGPVAECTPPNDIFSYRKTGGRGKRPQGCTPVAERTADYNNNSFSMDLPEEKRIKTVEKKE